MTREEMIKRVCEELIDLYKEFNRGKDRNLVYAEKILYETCENCEYSNCVTCSNVRKCDDGETVCPCEECKDYDQFQPKE